MQTFQFPEPITGKLSDIVVLSQKNRQPGDNPGAQLSINLRMGNAILDKFAADLKPFFYRAATEEGGTPQQGAIDAVEPISDMPVLSETGRFIKGIAWEKVYTGYTLVIDYGTGGTSNLVVKDCMVSKIHLKAEDDGICDTDMKVETQDMAGDVFGKLAGLKNREITFTLMPPEIQQAELPMKNPMALDLTAADRAPANSPFETPFDAFSRAVEVN